MKTRTIIILAFLGLSLLGGANFTKAQTISNYALVCIDEEEEEIEFSVTGIDPELGSGGVLIKNSFTVEKGGEFRIE